MPKSTLLQESDQLVELVLAHHNGIGVEELLQATGHNMPRRTLQRRLALLIDQGRIQPSGKSRAVRYTVRCDPVPKKIYSAQHLSPGLDIMQPMVDVWVPISPAGEEIRTVVRQPRALKKSVGYQRAFLDRYHPNHTAYLPQSTREQLHGMGRSPAAQMEPGTFARDIMNRLLIDLSWASSKLEGNTYSHLDTALLIEFGQAAEDKNALETQMILNHKDAIEYLVRNPEPACLSPDTILALHALLSNKLMTDPLACGRLRQIEVGIGGSVYIPPAFPAQVEELFGIVIQMAAEIHDPFEQAFFLMVHLPYLQPFEDVNKRVSRLAANIPFIHHNLCPLSFLDVPQQHYVDAMLGVYELNRIELLRDVYIWAYGRSCYQYVAVEHKLVPPDAFYLRYRQVVKEVVTGIICNDEAATHATIRDRTPETVANTDIECFIRLVLDEFRSLHAGNAIRFGIRPLEYGAWQNKHTTSKPHPDQVPGPF